MASRGRPRLRLAWNNVDLDVLTLLSFERPAGASLLVGGLGERCLASRAP
jgi:hypothetical protein